MGQSVWWFCESANAGNIVAAFQGLHVSPAKNSYAWLPRKCDYRSERQTDGRTDGQTDTWESDPYVPLCFAGDTIRGRSRLYKFPLFRGSTFSSELLCHLFSPSWHVVNSILTLCEKTATCSDNDLLWFRADIIRGILILGLSFFECIKRIPFWMGRGWS